MNKETPSREITGDEIVVLHDGIMQTVLSGLLKQAGVARENILDMLSPEEALQLLDAGVNAIILPVSREGISGIEIAQHAESLRAAGRSQIEFLFVTTQDRYLVRDSANGLTRLPGLFGDDGGFSSQKFMETLTSNMKIFASKHGLDKQKAA